MIDRVDIDALLIGALYGELTPADEARLTAHLVSHPADRAALADLTQTRATFRDSRILTVQFEPPQSVSALLLQEAARRAPRVAREASEGWFQRFVRSFLAHPAMAAATMLVLVAGVAGTVYLRHGDAFSDPQALSAAPAPAGEPASPRIAGDTITGTGSGAAPTAGETPLGSDAYRVRLDEAEAKGRQGEQADAIAKKATQNAKQEVARNDLAGPSAAAKDAKSLVSDGDRKERAPSDPEPTVREPAKPAKIMSKFAKKPSGIELRSAELMPKDLDDNQGLIKRDLGRARGDAVASANEHAGAFGANAPAGGGAASAAPGMLAAHPRPVAPAPSPDPSVSAGSAPSTAPKAKASVAVAKPAPPPAPPASAALEQAPAQAPRAEPRGAAEQAPATADLAVAGRDSRRGAAASDAKTARVDDKPAEDKALLGWAQKQRDQVIAFVRSNNCRAAANTATEIYNRAPEYYAANVATDRSVKPCLAYLNSEREREDRSRAGEREERSKAASKRALSTDTPAAAPAPPPARK